MLSKISQLNFNCIGFENAEKIPIKHTGRREDLSPEFVIQNLLPNAKTIAIVMDDIKHHIFGTFNHWVIWNIPAKNNIQGGIPTGKILPSLGNAMQGIGYGRYKYAGPKPPKGKQHIYKFSLYVLDCEISLKNNARKENLLKAIKPYVIQQGEITCVFE